MTNKKKWTIEEEHILSIYYGKVSAREINKNYLPDRSRGAIKIHAKILGLNGNQNQLNKIYHTKYKEGMIEKPCSTCRTIQPIANFSPKNRGVLKCDYQCHNCVNQQAKERFKRPEVKTRYKSASQKLRYNLRKTIIDHYGLYCHCQCGCTEDIYDFLTIEHLSGGGTKHQKERGEFGVYKDIINNNFPSNFTILCYNCNCAKAHKANKNICPRLLFQINNRLNTKYLDKHAEWMW